MQQKLIKFWTSEDGAVTVDWVVLTGAIVGLGILVLIPIGYSAGEGAQSVGDYIANLNSGYGNN